MEKVHLQRKKLTQTNADLKYFGFLMQNSNASSFLSSSSSHAWFPVNFETSPSSHEPGSAASSSLTGVPSQVVF